MNVEPKHRPEWPVWLDPLALVILGLTVVAALIDA